MPLALTFHHPIPPGEQRLVRAWFAGNVTDKEMARALNISPRSVADGWQRLAFRLRLPIMANRQHAVVELLNRGWIEIARKAAIWLLCIATATSAGDQFIRARRTRTRREVAYHQQTSQWSNVV